MRGYDSRSVLLLKRCLQKRHLRSWGHARNFLTSVQPGVDKLLTCTLCESLEIWKIYLLYSVLKWNLLTAIRTWHPDSPPLEEAPTWPLTSHQGKEILTVKCFQSRSSIPSVELSKGSVSFCIPRRDLASNLHLDGKVIHYVIRQVQPGPSLTSVLSGAEISASDVRDS